MTRKNGLPSERHHAIGLELARMRDRLTALTVEIMNAYPKGSRPYELAEHAVRPVDELRSELDRRFFAEHPYATPDAYYPPPELRNQP